MLRATMPAVMPAILRTITAPCNQDAAAVILRTSLTPRCILLESSLHPRFMAEREPPRPASHVSFNARYFRTTSGRHAMVHYAAGQRHKVNTLWHANGWDLYSLYEK